MMDLKVLQREAALGGVAVLLTAALAGAGATGAYADVTESDANRASQTSMDAPPIEQPIGLPPVANSAISSTDEDSFVQPDAIVSEEAKAQSSESAEQTTEGWVERDGERSYLQDGKALTNWFCVDGAWYYADGSGVVQTGWLSDGGNWYYLQPDTGAMAMWWFEIGDSWYYANGSGIMQTGWVYSGGKWYHLADSGRMQRGWLLDGGHWYYLRHDTGAMAVWWFTYEDSWYYANGSGIMQTGWVCSGGNWYYLANSGIMQTGWLNWNNKQYYLDPETGIMAASRAVDDDGVLYYMASDGTFGTGWFTDGEGAWHYALAGGALKQGWFKYAGGWYYLDPSIANYPMRTGFFYEANGGTRLFCANEGGWLELGWFEQDGARYFADADYVVQTGFFTCDAKRYYGDPANNGAVRSGALAVDGTEYRADENGALFTSQWLDAADGDSLVYAGKDGAICAYGERLESGAVALCDEDGALLSGWQEVDGSAVYCDSDTGEIATGWFDVEGATDRFHANDQGIVSKGWYFEDGWYYFEPASGAMQTAWLTEGSDTYYLDPETGVMQTGWAQDGNSWYHFASSGKLQRGWLKDGSYWYHLGSSGKMDEGWYQEGSSWYYFVPRWGAMCQSEWYVVDGKKYYFDGNGRWRDWYLSGDEELDVIVGDILDNQVGRGDGALRRAYDYMVTYPYISQDKYPTGAWSIPYAKEMYHNGGGNCYRYAALFCWLARGLGYDADVVSGGLLTRSGATQAHGWTEIYVDGTTYICDTEVQHKHSEYNFYMVTYKSAPYVYVK